MVRMNRPDHRFAAFFLVTALASQAVLAQDGPPPPTVRVDQAQRQSMASVIQAPGTVVSRNDARIAAEISGRLSWVAEVGDVIESGDVIARIDDRELELQLQEDDSVVWVSGEQELSTQPDVSLMHRIEDWFFSHMPIEDEL